MRPMRGFTLLEVMIAISLLGLLLALAASSLATANRSVRSTSAYAERLEQVRAAQRFLRQTIEHIPTGPFGGTAQLFDGQAQHMSFVAAVPGGLGGQLKRQSLGLVFTQPDQGQLQIAFSDRSNGQPWGEPQVLMDALNALSFQYKGQDEAQNPTPWLDHWPWPERLPQAVRVAAQCNGAMSWPVLIVAVHSATPGGAQP